MQYSSPLHSDSQKCDSCGWLCSFLRDVVGSLQFEAAHPLLQQALVMVGTIPESGQDAELVSCIMSKLAWLLRRTGRLDEATDMGRQALRHRCSLTQIACFCSLPQIASFITSACCLCSQQASAVGVVETAVCHANLGVLLRQQVLPEYARHPVAHVTCVSGGIE